MSRNYECVVVEVRPRLQSVNVFVTLSGTHESVKVLPASESVDLVVDDTTCQIPCQGLSIVPDSLTCLRVTENHVAFRFATNRNPSDNFGGFKTELLQNTVASIASLSNKPLLSKGINYTVQCANCGKPLSNAIKFQRILPLPSDNADMNEWFCHAHTNVNLDPKEADLFYTHCYVHVNRNNVVNVKRAEKVIVCKSCLNWLGVLHNPDTVKLWFNTVNFFDNGTLISTNSLTDVLHSIKDVVKHSLYNSLKMILSCQTGSDQTDSVLIWIMEKQLQVLFDGHGTLKKYDVAKVLFRFVKNSDHISTQWQNDSTVTVLNVSKPMIVVLLKHLHKFNKVLPREYAKSNDFFISYLFLYDSFRE